MDISILKDTVRGLTIRQHEEMVGIRRHLHQHPELSFEEVETGAYIASRLKEWGIPFTTGWAGHGVVGMLDSGRSGPVVALRADIDALPIMEIEDRSYRSLNPGIMHACGHDVHTTCLLGAVKILQALKTSWRGKVKLIFQPGEEKFPGGASIMIDEGVLKDPVPNVIFGQHVLPDLATGLVGFREGMYMAACDELYLCVEGKGGHAAFPHKNIDPIAITSLLITSLQQVVGRYADPISPTVLSFGKIWSECGATNIIPNKVFIEGTLRTLDNRWRDDAHVRLRKMVEEIGGAMGATCHLEIRKGYPPLVNDPETTRFARQWAEEYMGADKVVDLDIRMGAEDFAYFSQEMPATFYRLGTGGKDGRPYPGLHTPDFDIDEDALAIGSGLMAWLTLRQLAG
jgi:amidohydrolase